MPWLLDTNVVSELGKPKPDPLVLEFIASCPLDQLFVSTVTLAELRHGINLLVELQRRDALEAWLTTTLRPMFTDRVVVISESVMVRWLALYSQGRKSGQTYSQPDLILAATALEHNMIFATRNTGDFTRVPGLKLSDPWIGQT